MSGKNLSLRKKGNIFRITVTSIVILSCLLIANISIASAYDFEVGEFSQRKLVTIDNRGNANALTDYQVKIDVAYEPEMQLDFDDLRFTDTSDNILDYWIENYIPSTSAVVWVKVPLIPGSGTTKIYMYYGNGGVGSKSDGDAVFEFFDDFEDGVILSPWIEVENKGTITETNGYLETPECGQCGNQYCQDGYAYVYFDISDAIPGWDITKPFRIRVENWNQEDNTGGEAATTCLWNTDPHHNWPLDAVFFYHIDGNTADTGRYFGCNGGTGLGDYGPLENRWIIEEFRFDGNEMSLWFDEVEKDSFSWSASEGFIVLGNTRDSEWSIDNNKWDNIFVAKYADPEPIVSFAPTEPTNLITNLIFEDDFSTDKSWTSYPDAEIIRNPAEENVQWHVDRDWVQYMTHPITPFSSDFRLKVDAMIIDRENNCWIDIGLTDDMDDVTSSRWEGLALRIGCTGGGTPYSIWYAHAVGKYDDGTGFSSTSGHVTPSENTLTGYVPISPGAWYSYDLAKTGSDWTLAVYDADDNLVGSLSGTLTGSFSSFNYVYFGNGDTHDWPSANGKIDNLELFGCPTELPDLTLSPDDISFSPSNPKSGDDVTISFKIKNEGGADSDPFEVLVTHKYQLETGIGEGATIGEKTINSLEAGESTETLDIDWKWMVTRGPHEVCVIVDSGKHIDEGEKENNNRACKTIEIGCNCDDKEYTHTPIFTEPKKALILVPYYKEGIVGYSKDLKDKLEDRGWDVMMACNDLNSDDCEEAITVERFEDWLGEDFAIMHFSGHGYTDGWVIEHFDDIGVRDNRWNQLINTYGDEAVEKMFELGGADEYYSDTTINIKGDFIRKRCAELDHNPLIYFESCFMGVNEDMKEAFVSKGAGSYVGFDKEVKMCNYWGLWGISCLCPIDHVTKNSGRFYINTLDKANSINDATDRSGKPCTGTQICLWCPDSANWVTGGKPNYLYLSQISSNYIEFAMECPVDLIIEDPDNFGIDKGLNEITGATYLEMDINGDNEIDDYVFIPQRKMGDYQITVIPEPNAEPTDTYTLEVSAGDTTIVLAEDVPISDIPDQPYLIESTETEINAAPIAEAEIQVEIQPKPLIEEPDDNYIIEGNTFEGATITLDATTSYDPEGNPLTYDWSGAITGTGAMLGTYLSIGEHQVILTVSGGTLTATDVLDITIRDTILPEVSAEFIPIDVEEDEGLFEISYSATDICDPDPDTTGIILTPQLFDPEVEFHVEEEIKLEYDLEENVVDVKGPDPEALWQEIQELGGLRVEDGLQVCIEPEEEPEEVEIKYEDGILKIEEYIPTLKVTSQDDSGNIGIATATPVFTPEEEEEEG